MPLTIGTAPNSSRAISTTRRCSSKVHEATSDACAFTVIAESPSTAATSRRCARKEASSIERSSWKGSRTAGMTPLGTYSLVLAKSFSGAGRERRILTAIIRRMNDPRAIRRAIREGKFRRHTAGVAPGYVQGNVCILPREYADEFREFCELNPKPCPLLAMSAPGDPRLRELGEDLDIRTDVPRYRVFRDGVLTEEVTDLRDLWRPDLVTFVLGCSFSFEEALTAEGLRLRYVEQGTNVPMFRTNVDCAPAGRFRGKLVVSMRPFKPADAIRAVEITSRYPRVHGSPVHLGKPELIGIDDIGKPWAGDPTEVLADELPVFWACGITPQSVVLDAKPSLCITHSPGHMLVTDLRNDDLQMVTVTNKKW